LAAMIPSPGEAPRDYWTNTGYQPAKLDHVEPPEGASAEDAATIATFFHDVPPELAAEALKRVRDQSETPAAKPWPVEAWPDAPTRFLLCRDDRLFPADRMRRRATQWPPSISSGVIPKCSFTTRAARRNWRTGSRRTFPIVRSSRRRRPPHLQKSGGGHSTNAAQHAIRIGAVMLDDGPSGGVLRHGTPLPW
jgi:hypothetical protein